MKGGYVMRSAHLYWDKKRVSSEGTELSRGRLNGAGRALSSWPWTRGEGWHRFNIRAASGIIIIISSSSRSRSSRSSSKGRNMMDDFHDQQRSVKHVEIDSQHGYLASITKPALLTYVNERQKHLHQPMVITTIRATNMKTPHTGHGKRMHASRCVKSKQTRRERDSTGSYVGAYAAYE